MRARVGRTPAGKPRRGLNLVIDIGNTNTVIGFFRDGAIAGHWRLATRRETTEDEVAWWLQGLMLPARVKRGMTGLAMASVVPPLDGVWMRALRKSFGLEPRVLDHTNCLGLKLDYEIPSQIGADRLANVLGAYSLGYREGVVLDFGTATTFDIFSDYTYWGGIICPGVQNALQGLARSAAKLSEVELRWPARLVGKTTEDALRTGLLHGTLGMVERLLDGILAEQPMRDPAIIATGGLAGLVQGRAPRIGIVEPHLTLIGLNFLLSSQPKRNQRKGRR